jgi:hypothetical protein
LRDDLTKVLCEQERPRSWDCYSNYRNLKEFEDRQTFDEEDFEDRAEYCRHTTVGGGGTRESMKHRYGYDAKSFGEHLTPLYGVIRKNVGRKWDKVYSELCKSFDRRSATGNHIFQHLFDQLAKPEDTFIGIDGKVWVRGSYWGAEAIRDSRYPYYVDPRDGILKHNTHVKSYKQVNREHAAKKAAELEKVRRVVDDDTELHLIDGVWFEVKFVGNPGLRKLVKAGTNKMTYYRTEFEYPYMYDVLKKELVHASRVAVSKRTISHKELKRYGLVA